MNKTLKIILELVKIIVSAILGYFGGNAFFVVFVRGCAGLISCACSFSAITSKMTQL